MSNDFPTIELDYKALKKELSEFDSKMPGVARRLMRAVNREVKKAVKKEARSRGYLAHKNMEWGDAGYTKNIFTYANKDYTGKIMMGKNAFQYKFLEYGANVRPKNGDFLTFKIGDQFYKSKGFTLPANPLIYPIANGYWGTSKASAIMEAEMQKIMDKQFPK